MMVSIHAAIIPKAAIIIIDILKAGTRSDVPIAFKNAAHSDPTPTAAAKCPKPPAPLEKVPSAITGKISAIDLIDIV